jgi:hypothetical protein
VITQTGNNVTVVDDDGGITYTGTVSGANYTTSATYPYYPEIGGTVTVAGNYTLSSSTTGSGNVTWTWTDGIWFCNGGYQASITKVEACDYSISPTSQSFNSDGGSGSVSVIAPDGCDWMASSNVLWITITSGNSGSGNGTVNYSVLPNTSTNSRVGTMTIAGKTFTVTQSRAGPDINANGSDGPVTPTDNLSVTVALRPGSRSGENADWWVAANVSGTSTIDGWYYFDLSAFDFVPVGDSAFNLLVTLQEGLFNLPTSEILNIPVSAIPSGTYTFYLAVDMNMNGLLDLDELFFDSVVVNIP